MKNIWRIIFWGIILIISLSAGVLGVIYSNQNFNKRKNDLVNIVETFNSNQLINDYKKIDVNLTAKLSDKNIIVSYTGNVNKDYIFKFKKNYLETTISKNDSFSDGISYTDKTDKFIVKINLDNYIKNRTSD